MITLILKMKRLLLFMTVLATMVSCTNKKQNAQPNIIFFLADDLGYGEVGVYGQRKIQTPNIDALAQSGMRFTQHYSGAPVCAPARYVFLTGKHLGHAYIRGNDEWEERGDVWNYAKASADPGLEGQRPIPNTTVTIAHRLKDAGYKTGLFGKWGLGAPDTEGVPNAQGFDYFYGYNCQRQAHNLYPTFLWENDRKEHLDNSLVAPGTKLDSLADPFVEESYAQFEQKEYAPAKIHKRALAFLKQQNKNDPFFMYYASPLPHLPLQVPKEYVDMYKDKFEEDVPYEGETGYFPNRYPRAAYAGMITYLDNQLGELVVALKEQGLFENTLIVFTSDNGPTYLGGVDFDFFESSKPFTNGYGRTKGYVYEGGIRVPMIAAWPDRIEGGSVSDHVSAFYDFMPTFCELAGVDTPEGVDGISLLGSFFSQAQEEHDFLYWEFPSYNGQQAVRLGNWKGIRKDIFDGNLEIELYDLNIDLAEQNNVAAKHEDILLKIEKIMAREHEQAVNPSFRIKQLGDQLK